MHFVFEGLEVNQRDSQTPLIIDDQRNHRALTNNEATFRQKA